MLNELTEIGFKKVGEWGLGSESSILTITSEGESENILYCFVVDGIPKYIGKTTQQLKKRMYGYCKPAATQSSANIRNNENLRLVLCRGSVVDLYVLPDHGLLHFGQFHLNLAAGLEDSIVSMLSPEWNMVGK